MRIGIDARLLHYREGGIAVYIRQVVKALAAIDRESDFRVLHSRRDRHALTPGPNFRPARLWTPCHHRLEKWALAAEILPLRLNVLHSPDFIPPLGGAKRHVITVHDLNFLYYPQFLTAESRRYYNGQIRRAVRQADHILAVSEATRNDLVARLDVPPDKVTVHVEGVEPAFRPLSEEAVDAALQELALPRGYILFVGTFEPRKNIPGLLNAYQCLRAGLPDAPPLVLVGRRGWLVDDLERRVMELGLSSHVHWRENPPQALMPALYNAASLLAMPSFYEGFGLPALEAMACGLPTVVANRAALPEVVGDAGLLVDPDDPEDIAAGMRRLLGDSTLQAQLRAAGLERAKRFTWHQAAVVIHAVYQRLAT